MAGYGNTYPESPPVIVEATDIVYRGWMQKLWKFLKGLVLPAGIQPEAYGAVGDGVNDDTDAIQKAINVALNSTDTNVVLLSNRIYKITKQITIDLVGGKTITIRGVPGKFPATGTFANFSGTVIKCSFPALGDAIVIYNTGTGDPLVCNFELSDFNMSSADTTNCKRALQIGYPGYQFTGNQKNCVVRNVGIHQFHDNAITQINARCIKYENCTMTIPGSGSTGNCLSFIAEAGQFCGDSVVEDCVFTGTGTANQNNVNIAPIANGAAIRGIHFRDCISYYGAYSFMLNATYSGNTQLEDIWISNCAFDGIVGGGAGSINTAIALSAAGSNTLINNINIHDCYMVSWPSYGVTISNYGGGSVANNINITGNYFGVIQSIGVYAEGTVTTGTIEGLHVVNNRFSDCSGNVPIWLGHNVRDAEISMNTHITTGNPAPAAGIGYIVSLNYDCDWILLNNNFGKATIGPVFNGTTGVNIGLYNNFAH